LKLLTIEIITPIALTPSPLTCKYQLQVSQINKRKNKQLLGELINDASIGHLSKHLSFSNHVTVAVSIEMAFAGNKRCLGGRCSGVIFAFGTAFRWSL